MKPIYLTSILYHAPWKLTPRLPATFWPQLQPVQATQARFVITEEDPGGSQFVRHIDLTGTGFVRNWRTGGKGAMLVTVRLQ